MLIRTWRSIMAQTSPLPGSQKARLSTVAAAIAPR